MLASVAVWATLETPTPVVVVMVVVALVVVSVAVVIAVVVVSEVVMTVVIVSEIMAVVVVTVVVVPVVMAVVMAVPMKRRAFVAGCVSLGRSGGFTERVGLLIVRVSSHVRAATVAVAAAV